MINFLFHIKYYIEWFSEFFSLSLVWMVNCVVRESLSTTEHLYFSFLLFRFSFLFLGSELYFSVPFFVFTFLLMLSAFVHSFVKSRCLGNKTEQQMAFAVCVLNVFWQMCNLCTHLAERRWYARGASESLSPYKDADPWEWNCQDGFQCIMCLRYKFFARFSAVAPFMCLSSVPLWDSVEEHCDKDIAHTNLPHFKRWSFSLHMQLLALYFHCMHLHYLCLDLSPSIFMCHCFQTLFNIYSKNRKENSKSTLQFSANAMWSNVRNSFNICKRFLSLSSKE